MKGFSKLCVLLVMGGAILVGCSSAPKQEQTTDSGMDAMTDNTDAMADNGRDSMFDESEVETSGVSQPMGFQGHELDDPDSLLSKRLIYFDFDSAVVKDEYTAVVEAHANYLSSNPSARLTLEGHGDERGTREYNLGLGERRAMAVEQFLQLLGAAPSQLQNVSYGEERPLDFGHDEKAWQANRRVELVYDR